MISAFESLPSSFSSISSKIARIACPTADHRNGQTEERLNRKMSLLGYYRWVPIEIDLQRVPSQRCHGGANTNVDTAVPFATKQHCQPRECHIAERCHVPQQQPMGGIDPVKAAWSIEAVDPNKYRNASKNMTNAKTSFFK